MTHTALAVALLSLCSGAGRSARLYLATERPFAPDTPGAIVKLEVPGARSVDVRLYRIEDPERFFASEPDLRHTAAPAPPPSRTEGRGDARAADSRRGRAPGPLALAERSLLEAALDLRRAFDRGLSPAAHRLATRAARGPTGSGSGTLPFLRGLPLVERWDLACGSGDAEFSYCDLDVGPRPSGAYLVEAVAGREVAHAVALFTRLALVARRTEGAVAVLAVDSQTGLALPDTQLALLSPGQPTLRGATGKRGLFHTRLGARPLRLLGRRGADLALVELGPVRRSDADPGTLLVTDRGEYRPGERVVFHGFSRRADEKIPHKEEVEVEAFDARGSLFHTVALPLSAQGGFGGSFLLPAQLPQGLFRLVGTLDGHAAGAEFLVREAPRPSFSLQATLLAAAAGLPAAAEVRAERGGRPLPDVQVSWRAVRVRTTDPAPGSPEEIDRGDLPLGPEGRALLSFETLAGADARYELTVIGRDASGRLATAQATTTLSQHPQRVTLTPERKLVAPGTPVEVAVAAQDGAGTPLALDLRIRVQAARTPDGPRERVLGQDVRTGPSGSTAVSFTPAAPGYYEVEATRQGVRLAEAYLYVSAEGGDIPFSPEALVVVPDRSAYSVGETARLLVLAPFDTATALVTVEGQDLLRHDALAVRGSSAVFPVKITAAHAPHVTVSVQAVAAERTWQVQRVLPVLPQGEALTVRGACRVDTAPRLEVEVVDAAGRPVPGAELFAVVRDARSVPAPAPPLLAFFHPTRLSEGRTGTSTGLRNSSAGVPFPRAAYDAVEDGYLPYKGLSQGRPRERDRGTLLATSAVTDARGRASWPLDVAADLGALATSVRAAAGPAFGEWSAGWERTGGAGTLEAPPFLRPGDASRAQGLADGQPIELRAAGESARGTGSVSLPLAGSTGSQQIDARFGEASATRAVATAPAAEVVRVATSGLAGPGRQALPLPAGEGPLVLHLSGTAPGAAAAARAGLAEADPRTEARLAALLARLAEWSGREDVSRELRDAALVDVAALVGVSHPEGTFGAYDGAAVDPSLTELSLLALGLAREAGLEVEEGALSRGASGLLARRDRTAAGDLALALLDELGPQALQPRLARDRSADGLPVGERAMLAWALDRLEERSAATEVATRLERSARLQGPLACFAEACPGEAAPAQARRDTALAVLALRRALPRSPVLAPAVRWLLATRGASDWARDLPGALSALALAEAGDRLALRPSTVVVESNGRPLTVPAPPRTSETGLVLGTGPVVLTAAAPVAWRLERAVALTGAKGAIGVERTFQRLDGSGRPLPGAPEVGDRVRVTVALEATAAAGGPVRLQDPYPAGLAPIEQEGEHEQHRKLSDRAQRLFRADRVVFLLPTLGVGRTIVEWEAIAAHPGRFLAAPASVVAGALEGLGAQTPLEILPRPASAHPPAAPEEEP